MQTATKINISMTPDMLRAVRESVEDVEQLNAIRARIRRSLDDPRPDLSAAEVDATLNTLVASARFAF